MKMHCPLKDKFLSNSGVGFNEAPLAGGSLARGRACLGFGRRTRGWFTGPRCFLVVEIPVSGSKRFEAIGGEMVKPGHIEKSHLFLLLNKLGDPVRGCR